MGNDLSFRRWNGKWKSDYNEGEGQILTNYNMLNIHNIPIRYIITTPDKFETVDALIKFEKADNNIYNLEVVSTNHYFRAYIKKDIKEIRGTYRIYNDNGTFEMFLR